MKNIIKNRSRKTMKNNTISNLKKYKIAKNNSNQNIMSGGGNSSYSYGNNGPPGITKNSWLNKFGRKVRRLITRNPISMVQDITQPNAAKILTNLSKEKKTIKGNTSNDDLKAYKEIIQKLEFLQPNKIIIRNNNTFKNTKIINFIL